MCDIRLGEILARWLPGLREWHGLSRLQRHVRDKLHVAMSFARACSYAHWHGQESIPGQPIRIRATPINSALDRSKCSARKKACFKATALDDAGTGQGAQSASQIPYLCECPSSTLVGSGPCASRATSGQVHPLAPALPFSPSALSQPPKQRLPA